MPREENRLILGRTNWRDLRKLIGIKQADRLHHLYVIGQTGTGKSTLLENLMRQDLDAGRGFAFLDPHADTIGKIAASVPENRHGDVIYLNVPDPACEFGFNPLDTIPPDQRP